MKLLVRYNLNGNGALHTGHSCIIEYTSDKYKKELIESLIRRKKKYSNEFKIFIISQDEVKDEKKT